MAHADEAEGGSSGQGSLDQNVVFGTCSGLALLLDVHRPPRPNGYALVVVPGSGWTSEVAMMNAMSKFTSLEERL